MRTLVLAAALPLLGCSGAFTGALINPSTTTSASTPSEREALEQKAEERRIDEHIEQSRARLVSPVPQCDVKVSRLSPRSWNVSSCDAKLKCWELTMGGYECERAVAAGDKPL